MSARPLELADVVRRFGAASLDLAFVAGPAKDWQAECKVIVTENDFPDGPTKSDHRPVELIVRP